MCTAGSSLIQKGSGEVRWMNHRRSEMAMNWNVTSLSLAHAGLLPMDRSTLKLTTHGWPVSADVDLRDSGCGAVKLRGRRSDLPLSWDPP